MLNNYVPLARNDLNRFRLLLAHKTPFTFIRFSDGEMEVLRNRYLEIGAGYTVFQGKRLSNNFPVYDQKKFDPNRDASFRSALLDSAKKQGNNYFKGIPTFHNNLVADRDFMVSLNGGMSEFMTFSDLLINSNYVGYRKGIVPLFASSKNLALVANYRATPQGELSRARLIPIGDNIFNRYEAILEETLSRARQMPEKSMILSSASSLSNILGMYLYQERPDITFLDIGTSLNDLLGLKSVTRAYHRLFFRASLYDLIFSLRYRITKEYRIKW